MKKRGKKNDELCRLGVQQGISVSYFLNIAFQNLTLILFSWPLLFAIPILFTNLLLGILFFTLSSSILCCFNVNVLKGTYFVIYQFNVTVFFFNFLYTLLFLEKVFNFFLLFFITFNMKVCSLNFLLLFSTIYSVKVSVLLFLLFQFLKCV